MKKVILFANTSWYLYNFRLALAERLRSENYEVVFIAPHDGFTELLKEQGFRVVSIPMDRRSLNPFREFLLILKIKEIIQLEKPLILHNFTLKCIFYGSIAARMVGLKRVINSIEGLGFVFISNSIKARLLRPCFRFLLYLITHFTNFVFIILNTEDLKELNSVKLFSENRLRLIKGTGVDLNKFHPSTDPIKCSVTKVLMASRLLWDKGVGEYIEAARLLNLMNLPIKFMLAGATDKGNPRSISEDRMEQWRNEGIIELLGQVGDMSSLLRQVDIFVLPSYREGLPNSLIEAGASGLPIVATDVPGCRDVVEDGVNGLLVKAEDAKGLANAILALYNDPELMGNMGNASLEKVTREFDQKLIFSQTLEYYNEILGEQSINLE